jgi:hypothetical protein
MINWFKQEWQNIQNSKTIKLAYLKKLAGLVTFLISISGFVELEISPMWFGIGLAVLGMLDDKLRKLTTESLGAK